MRREYNNTTGLSPLIETYTSNQTLTPSFFNEMIELGYNNMSIFLVGGGGGGSGDGWTRGNTGTGGGGGECITINNLQLNATSLTMSIGAGGSGSAAKTSSGTTGKAGGNTTVTYNGTTYIANGGYGGDSYVMSKNTIFTNYPRGNRKFGGWGGGTNVAITTAYTQVKTYYNYTPEQYIKEYPSTTNIHYSSKGETGIKNPFDSTDTTVYGCGGGGGYDPYDWYTQASDKTYYSKIQSEFPNYGGDNNAGGGRGGYGDNNASTNCGHNATSYGSGGGGGAFSSGHKYGYGGNGMQGIVILKFS